MIHDVTLRFSSKGIVPHASRQAQSPTRVQNRSCDYLKPKLLAQSLLFALWGLATPTLLAADLTLHIQGAEPQSGVLRVGLFDQAAEFPEGQATHGQEISVTRGDQTVVFPALPPGHYAVAVFQDLNDNQELDRNFFGIPKEPYGFSRVEDWGEPDFDEAAFDLPATGKIIRIKLQ